jgi:5-methyltetrahydropteroyltriglutamate--homocysteine methyltransferase
LADCFQGDYAAVVAAGFVLQRDDPALVTRFGMANPPLRIAGYRKQVAMRIEATHSALRHMPEDRRRYHTWWGSWPTPHTTDLPFRHVLDLMLQVKAQAYAVEAADVRHQLDWPLWEAGQRPEGQLYIPGVVAPKTTPIEPPAWVAERLVTYAKIMGREHVIAGPDCGYGTRVSPDSGWAKMRAGADGAAWASTPLWPRGS